MTGEETCCNLSQVIPVTEKMSDSDTTLDMNTTNFTALNNSYMMKCKRKEDLFAHKFLNVRALLFFYFN